MKTGQISIHKIYSVAGLKADSGMTTNDFDQAVSEGLKVVKIGSTEFVRGSDFNEFVASKISG